MYISLVAYGVSQDISSRTNDSPLPEGYSVTLEVVTYIGVCLSLLGLTITILTLIIFR